MCEFSEKLIAWLDQELPAEQAANVARHVRACAECCSRVEDYRHLNETIDAYCDAAFASKAKRRSNARVWRPVFVVTGAAAASVLLFLLLGPVEHLRQLFSPVVDAVPAIALKATPSPAPTIERMPTAAAAEKFPNPIDNRRRPRRLAPLATASNHDENWLPNEAPVFIAIPADALFPPGALPEGVGFIADINLRPDGSAQRLRLQPQLIGFQTRGARP